MLLVQNSLIHTQWLSVKPHLINRHTPTNNIPPSAPHTKWLSLKPISFPKTKWNLFFPCWIGNKLDWVCFGNFLTGFQGVWFVLSLESIFFSFLFMYKRSLLSLIFSDTSGRLPYSSLFVICCLQLTLNTVLRSYSQIKILSISSNRN